MAHPFDEGLDNKEARKLWRQNGGLWESTKDNARAGWQTAKDTVGKGANFAGEQAKKVINVVGKNPAVKAAPGMLKKTPHVAVILEGANSLGSAHDRVNNSGLDAAPDVGEASAIAGLSNMIYGSPDKIRGLFTGEKDDRFDRGANEFSQAVADRFIDVASFFGAADPRENIKQNAFVPGKVDEPTKKKGLTQAQMKSRIAASAYANDDPNKWGLNGKMPQGWGAVKKSNGEVVVTPPSESNFWGDPEAEKAWRAAEANRKMGLWSMEKTMDPTASLKERQLAADIYDMRLRQQAAAGGSNMAAANFGLRQQQAINAALDDRLKSLDSYRTYLATEKNLDKNGLATTYLNPEYAAWLEQAWGHIKPSLVKKLQEAQGDRAIEESLLNDARYYLALQHRANKALNAYAPMDQQKRAQWSKPGWKIWGDADRYYIRNAFGEEIELPMDGISPAELEYLARMSGRPTLY